MRLITILLTFVLFFPVCGYAQSESQTYDPTYMGAEGAAEKMKAQMDKKQEAQGFVSPTSISVALVHENYMEPHQVGIQMSLPDVVSGCFTFSPLEYEANFVDPYYLDIKVKKYRKIEPSANPDKRKCDAQNKTSSAMMVLDKNDLQSRGTKQIRFSTEGGRDTYSVLLNDNTLALIPETMSVFKGANLGGELKDRLVYNFNGATTIALQVPMANAGEDITDEIMAFATAHGLTPSQNNPTMSLSDNDRPTYHFEDASGRFSGMVGADGYGEIGTISVMRPYDGPDGRMETPVELRVFVTRPGTEL